MLKVIELSPDESGLRGLLGKNVLLLCSNYFYWGRLVGINDTFVVLDNAHVVYETGNWSDSKLKDSQKIGPNPLIVMLSAVESATERD